MEFIKDITQFLDIEAETEPKMIPDNRKQPQLSNKRNVRTSLLLDTKPLNFILNPDNCIPCEKYTADYMYSDPTIKDDFLLQLIDDLEEFKAADDVRPLSRKKFNVIQNLHSSKLV